MSKTDSEKIIEKFKLEPHPEGGYFRETYRSSATVDTPAGERNASTAIYYLLSEGDFSAFHRIKSDELWHFYAGNTMEIIEITEEGALKRNLLGSEGENVEPQAVITAGNWFAARLLRGGYAFVGCTVSPGFDFADFEQGDRESLVKLYPAHKEIISALTRK